MTREGEGGGSGFRILFALDAIEIAAICLFEHDLSEISPSCRWSDS
jgi:hypothetical protein